MNFMHRHRRLLSLFAVTTFLLAGSVTPASAIYNPKTGRWMQRDPNGVGVVLQPSLSCNAANPVITVSMAYELQYADGMNFYEYLRSNSVNHNDPTGLMTLPELAMTQSTSAYMRAAQFSLFGVAGVGTYGGVRAGYDAFSQRKSSREIALAALGGFNSTLSRPELLARVLLSSAIISVSGPGGLAVLAGLGVVESGQEHIGARQAQEYATTQSELDLATFDSMTSGLSFVLNATSMAAGLTVARPLQQLRFRGRPPRNLNEQMAVQEAMAGSGTVKMTNLSDPGLQAVRRGQWNKRVHIRNFGDGTRVEVHTSVHTQTGLIWDIKIKSPP